jgi:hypothetical protein
MKAESWIHDARMLSREVDHFAIRLGADSGHDHRSHAFVTRALDTGRRVGILLGVEMNVSVYHMIPHKSSRGVIITAVGRAGIAR